MSLTLIHEINAGDQCQLLGSFGWYVQIALGLVSFSSLLLKRYMDLKRRSWTIWFMVSSSQDASKQGFGAGFTHIFNVVAAIWIGTLSKGVSPCVWYFLSILTDVAIGTCLCYLFLVGIEQCLSNVPFAAFKTGYYEDPPSWCSWVYQVFVWLVIVLIMKICMIGVMIFFKVPLEYFGEFLLLPFKLYPKLELVFVMILVPVVLNALMFWITDGFLKHTAPRKSAADLLIMKPVTV